MFMQGLWFGDNLWIVSTRKCLENSPCNEEYWPMLKIDQCVIFQRLIWSRVVFQWIQLRRKVAEFLPEVICQTAWIFLNHWWFLHVQKGPCWNLIPNAEFFTVFNQNLLNVIKINLLENVWHFLWVCWWCI